MNLQKQPSRGVLRKRCSENMQQITGEHPCWSVISIKLQSNFIEISLQCGCSPVNLLHIFKTPFYNNTSGWLLLHTFWMASWLICCSNFVLLHTERKWLLKINFATILPLKSKLSRNFSILTHFRSMFRLWINQVIDFY